MSEVHSGLLKAGPGNLSGSTKGARQLFNQAHSLLEALRNHRDMHFTVLDALARIHFKLSSEKGMVQHLNDMSDEEAIQIGQFKKGETVDQARNLKTLADAVYFDFVLEKTGGGSCDHSSAATFFKLTEAFPEAKIKIVRYKPKSGGGYEIQPPEGLPWHRTVFFKNEEDRLNVDSWWPEGGKIESREELDYPEVETVVKWSSLNKAFVAALRIELEHQYKQIQGELPTEVDDTVGAVWTISTG